MKDRAAVRPLPIDLPNGNWVLENVDLHFTLTEGFASWIHMHGIHMLPQLRGLMDYNLSGWDGAAVLGQAILVNQFNNHPVNESALVANLFHRFNQEFTWPGLTDAEMGLLLKPDFQRQTTGLLIDEFCSLFHPYWQARIRRRLGIFPKHATLYADYENLLRHEPRPWAESVFFDPRTEQRGFFEMDFVRDLLERHYAGIEPWTLGKIAPLITFEMVLRAFFD